MEKEDRPGKKEGFFLSHFGRQVPCYDIAKFEDFRTKRKSDNDGMTAEILQNSSE